MPIYEDVEFRWRRRTAAAWLADDPILAEGEPGKETDTGWFKLGDGSTPWSGLPYFKPAGSSDPGGVSEAMMIAHINDLSPHPVYDDGPSLLLLYKNAKV